jgi:broad specificity phosphatase PhoE
MKKDHVGLQRRPFLTPVWLAAMAAVVVLGFATWLWSTANSTTVILVRHAEQETGSITDPPLSAAGEERAQRLARMFGDPAAPGRVDAIYVTPTVRSRMTAAPLAARLSLTPTMATDAEPRALVRRLLHEHAGGRVLVIGHADTLPEIVRLLSGESVPPMGPQDYGTVYVVMVPRMGRANVLRLTY